MGDLDNAMDVLDALEERKRASETLSQDSERMLVGNVEYYYQKLGVVAITLEGTLKLGDVIEIGDEDEAVRQKVLSMQIDREDVSEAQSGESVGIKIRYPVPQGAKVYKL